MADQQCNQRHDQRGKAIVQAGKRGAQSGRAEIDPLRAEQLTLRIVINALNLTSRLRSSPLKRIA